MSIDLMGLLEEGILLAVKNFPKLERYLKLLQRTQSEKLCNSLIGNKKQKEPIKRI